MLDATERAYVESARVGRLATADADGRPHVVPICFALVGDQLVSAVDEKPQSADATGLRRSRNVSENPHAAVIVDHYVEDWDALGWVQLRGRADHLAPDDEGHGAAVDALRAKYDQYADHDLAERPIVRLRPETVRSWGTLDRQDDG